MPNVSLTPAMERAIEEAVRAGEYASVSEVVREGIRLWLQNRDREGDGWRAFASEIDQGWRESERGETVPFDMDEVIARAKIRRSRA